MEAHSRSDPSWDKDTRLAAAEWALQQGILPSTVEAVYGKDGISAISSSEKASFVRAPKAAVMVGERITVIASGNFFIRGSVAGEVEWHVTKAYYVPFKSSTGTQLKVNHPKMYLVDSLFRSLSYLHPLKLRR